MHSQIHSMVDGCCGPPFCPGVKGTSSLISDHHVQETPTAPLIPLEGLLPILHNHSRSCNTEHKQVFQVLSLFFIKKPDMVVLDKQK